MVSSSKPFSSHTLHAVVDLTYPPRFHEFFISGLWHPEHKHSLRGVLSCPRPPAAASSKRQYRGGGGRGDGGSRGGGVRTTALDAGRQHQLARYVNAIAAVIKVRLRVDERCNK
jgi:hypothetical protein